MLVISCSLLWKPDVSLWKPEWNNSGLPNSTIPAHSQPVLTTLPNAKSAVVMIASGSFGVQGRLLEDVALNKAPQLEVVLHPHQLQAPTIPQEEHHVTPKAEATGRAAHFPDVFPQDLLRLGKQGAGVFYDQALAGEFVADPGPPPNALGGEREVQQGGAQQQVDRQLSRRPPPLVEHLLHLHRLGRLRCHRLCFGGLSGHLPTAARLFSTAAA
mmetsp:Transcript_10683/g.32105  ORF Transcript_10683/g.32105 Transcript_10683/m.32105 type:complete len:214 (+) Transcript_10683:3043-3684(+)